MAFLTFGLECPGQHYMTGLDQPKSPISDSVPGAEKPRRYGRQPPDYCFFKGRMPVKATSLILDPLIPSCLDKPIL